MFRFSSLFAAAALVAGASALPAAAHDSDEQPIVSESSQDVPAEFDIATSRVIQIGSTLYFSMRVYGDAGAAVPEPTGAVPGSDVLSYVFPTSLDSASVGFEPDQGILALAVTSHPDFDDTPLWDENGDGDPANDGVEWHSHWVVLTGDEACGEGGLKVRDIEAGQTPAVPQTWPELPILIDSPNFALEIYRSEVVVAVPATALGEPEAFNFDGVTAGLRVNANLHNPFLCVTGVFDIASGDLSLPGVAGR
jgi:hypothetical protein